MLDYRIHYAVMATEDRLRPTRQAVLRGNRGTRRIFRLGARDEARGSARH